MPAISSFMGRLNETQQSSYAYCAHRAYLSGQNRSLFFSMPVLYSKADTLFLTPVILHAVSFQFAFTVKFITA